MKYSISMAERYLIHNQLLILDKLCPNEKYGATAKEVLYGYNLDSFFNGFYEPLSEENQSFVRKVLDMFSMLKTSYDQLKQSEKQSIDEQKILFLGFDGNKEGDLKGYADYVLSNEDGFSSIDRHRDFNSHIPMSSRYRGMLEKYQNALALCACGTLLTVRDISEIVS